MKLTGKCEVKRDQLVTYLKYRDQIRTGDGLLFDSDNMLGWTIQKFSKSDVNHYGIVFDEFNPLVSEGKYIIESLRMGPDFTKLSTRLQYFKGKIYWLPMKEEFEDWRIPLARWYLAQEGTQVNYNYISLIKNIFGRTKIDLNKMFCSEFGYLGWRYVYITKVMGVTDEERIKYWLTQDDVKILGFKKAPTPMEIENMIVWYPRVKIYDSSIIEKTGSF